MASSESEWDDIEDTVVDNNNDDDDAVLSASKDINKRPPRIKAVPAKLLESTVNKGTAIESQTSKSTPYVIKILYK